MGFPWRRLSFEKEVTPHVPVLFRIAIRLVGRVEDAEDLVQECLVRAFRGWKNFDGSYLRSWLVKIMLNQRNQELRRERSEGTHVELLEIDGVLQPFWDEALWRHDAHRIVEELGRMAPEYRVPIELCDVEGMSYEEAARVMELPLGTFKSRLHRGRHLLRKRVGGELATVTWSEK